MKTPIKNLPLNGTLINILLTEDLLRENSIKFLKLMMFCLMPIEDPLMIKWWQNNLLYKMLTTSLTDFSDKMKCLDNKSKSSSKSTSLTKERTITKSLELIKMQLWMISQTHIENLPWNTILKIIQMIRKHRKSLSKSMRLIKLFPIKLGDQHMMT